MCHAYRWWWPPVPPHIRGVFAQTDQQSNLAPINIGQGTVQRMTLDPPGTVWPAGVDNTPGRDHTQQYPPRNAGNYGVFRTFRFHLERDANAAYDSCSGDGMSGGGTTWALKTTNDGVPVTLRRTSDTLLDVMPIFNGAVDARTGADIVYPYMCIPEASAPVHVLSCRIRH